MSRVQATCRFCSKPDDSVQVLCESRCLICSRCQLVPVIRKLLIDHAEFGPLQGNSSNNINSPSDEPYRANTSNVFQANSSLFSNGIPTTIALKGDCPICSSVVSPSMLLLITSYRETFKNQIAPPNSTTTTTMINNISMTSSQIDDSTQAIKSAFEVELEEICPLIANFLKRFRTVYEIPHEKSLTDLDPETKLSIGHKTRGTNTSAANTTNPPEFTSKKDPNNIQKMPMNQVVDFLIDCYCLQWQSMLRGSYDSMITILMKQSNKKKFSQKTNDFKTKSLLDFLLSSNGAESSELFVFGHLIGILPRVNTRISAGWSHITTAILVICHFDKCMKQNILFDTMNPINMNDMRSKLAKSFVNSSYYLTNNAATTGKESNMTNSTNMISTTHGKMISIKKACKIIQFLFQMKHCYWIMTPITASCVEYQSKLPWSKESLSKLMNLLFFIAVFEPAVPSSSKGKSDGSNNNNNETRGNMTTPLNGAMSRVTSEANLNTTDAPPPPSASNLASRRSSAMSSFNVSMLNTYSTATSNPQVSNKTSILNEMINTIQKTGKPTNRMDMLKTLDVIIDQLWNNPLKPHPSLRLTQLHGHNYHNITGGQLRHNPQTTMHNVLHHFKSMEQYYTKGFVVNHTNATNENDSVPNMTSNFIYEYIECSLDEAMDLTDNLMIPLQEFLYVIIRTWEYEYQFIKQHLSRGMLTSQRRKGILGNYNATTAVMNATEKLALTKIFHFYYPDQESIEYYQGIDWDEVELHCQEGNFPFNIPFTLFKKTRNELNYLMLQIKELYSEKEQRKLQSRINTTSSTSSNKGIPRTMPKLTDNIGVIPTYLPTSSEQITYYQQKDQPTIGGFLHANISPQTSLHTYPTKQTPLVPPSKEYDLVDVLDNHHLKTRNAIQFSSRENNSRDDHDEYKDNKDDYDDNVPQSGVPYFPLEQDLASIERLKQHTAQLPQDLLDDLYQHQLYEFRKYRLQESRNRIIQRIETKETTSRLRTLLQENLNNNNNNNTTSSNDNMSLASHSRTPKAGNESFLTTSNTKSSLKDTITKHSRQVSAITSNLVASIEQAVNDNPYLKDMKMDFLKGKNRIIPYLDLSKSTTSSGELIIDLNNTLISESAVYYLTIQSANISTKSLDILLQTYCKPWQITQMKFLDLSGNPKLTLHGARLLAETFQTPSCLIHLNLNHMKISDLGCKLLFSSLISSNSTLTLQKLDLQDNDITLATESFALIKHFIHLKSLDLSCNLFTFDTMNQIKYFQEGFSALQELQYLSLSENKIQDYGLLILLECLLKYQIPLQGLSIEKCFITNKSNELLYYLSKSTEHTSSIEIKLDISDLRKQVNRRKSSKFSNLSTNHEGNHHNHLHKQASQRTNGLRKSLLSLPSHGSNNHNNHQEDDHLSEITLLDESLPESQQQPVHASVSFAKKLPNDHRILPDYDEVLTKLLEQYGETRLTLNEIYFFGNLFSMLMLEDVMIEFYEYSSLQIYYEESKYPVPAQPLMQRLPYKLSDYDIVIPTNDMMNPLYNPFAGPKNLQAILNRGR